VERLERHGHQSEGQNPEDDQEHRSEQPEEHHDVGDVESIGNPLNAGTDNLEEYEIGTGDAGFVQEDDVEHAITEHTGDVPGTKEALQDANTDTSPVGDEYTGDDEYTEFPLNNDDLYARPSVIVGEADFVEIENVDREEPNGDGAQDSSLTGVVGNNTERRESVVDHLFRYHH
jgi:hypothetical protein